MDTTSRASLAPVSPPSVPTPKKDFFIIKLPVEIRHMTYDILVQSEHTILIYPESQKRGILEPLRQVCQKIRTELLQWPSGRPNLATNLIFGVFDPLLTTFKTVLVG